MRSPFNLFANPSFIRVRPNYLAFLHAFRREYGITNPHHFYQLRRRQLLDRALPDPYGLGRHATLDDWWEAKVLAWKYADMTPSRKH